MTSRPKALLVLGGARSGKSSFAQTQAEASDLELVFVATAQPHDDEMRARIAHHVAARGARWQTNEAPFDVPRVVSEGSREARLLLVDCLTLWLSNLMLRGDDVEAAGQDLVSRIAALPGPVIFVSNEVGAGIVPETPLGRRFRDAQGRLNQIVASACTDVVFVAAGLPVVLKPSAQPKPLFGA